MAEQEFSRRRRRLMEAMGEHAVAVVPAAVEVTRSRDTEYPFRQDSDFHYLTGFPEPDALLVLLPGRAEGETVLFCRPRDPAMEQWTGRRLGPEGAQADYGVDQAWNLAELDERMPELLEGRQSLYSALGRRPAFDQRLLQWVQALRQRARSGARAPSRFFDLDQPLHEMRLFKSKGELDLMREAARISARAHVRAMQVCRPGLFEYQLEAEIQHEFAMAGARHPAYASIVGGGANGCILHYVDNDSPLREGELVLIDAGCEYRGYAADITRTFPVNGRFSHPQQALYEVVLAAQQAALEVTRPGHRWNEAHDATVQVITQGLVDLGLLAGEVNELVEREAYRPFYMHRAGHWLGLDVHDVGDYQVDGQWRPLAPGMVMTVEPGIYVAPELEQVDEAWRGIGIRIEDNVVITPEGHEVLTDGVPKDIDEIEQLMQGRA